MAAILALLLLCAAVHCYDDIATWNDIRNWRDFFVLREGEQGKTGKSLAVQATPDTPEKALATDQPETQIIYRCVNDADIALTYDDGISAFTEDFLQFLDKSSTKATFFILGKSLAGSEKNRDIARRIAKTHSLGLHSWNHDDLLLCSDRELELDFKSSVDIFVATIGQAPKNVDDRITAMASKYGMKTVKWNIDSDDWRNQHEPPGRSAATIREGLRTEKGPIVLQHDILKYTLDSQPDIIAIVTESGLRPVSMEECLGG